MELKRSNNGFISGVCKGISKATDIDVAIVRVLAILALLIYPVATVIIYILAALVLEKE